MLPFITNYYVYSHQNSLLKIFLVFFFFSPTCVGFAHWLLICTTINLTCCRLGHGECLSYGKWCGKPIEIRGKTQNGLAYLGFARKRFGNKIENGQKAREMSYRLNRVCSWFSTRLAERNQFQPDWLEFLVHVVLGGKTRKSLRSLPFGSCPPPRTDTWRWLAEAYCSTWHTSSAVLGLINALGLLEGLPLNSLFIDCSYHSCPSTIAIRFDFSHRTLMTWSLLVSSGLLMIQMKEMFCKRKREQEIFKRPVLLCASHLAA